jgi:YVTN family beta-propeller protein
VWVANEDGDSLSVIATETNEVVATVAGIKHPHNVQVSRDGDTVYAVSASNLVVAIDAATYAVNAVAQTGGAPAHVIEAPTGKVYVTNADDGTVSVYQGPKLAPGGEIDLGGMPHGLRSAAGGSVIVVANTMAGRLDLIDPATDQPTGSVPVGTEPAQVAVTADGRYAYSGVTDPPAVVKVDLVSRTVVGSVPVPTAPVQLYLTPDEKTVVSADQGTTEKPGHTVSVIDTAAMTVRGIVDTGSGPHGVVIDASGTWAWVTDTFDDTVSVIDMANLSTPATIAVGEAPNGISFSPRPPAAASAATVTLDIPAPARGAPTSEHQPTNSHGH